MKNLFNKLSLLVLSILFIACSDTNTRQEKTTKTYDNTWESLAKHNEAPTWFQDAKFGIYFHWGVYSVPAEFDEWYPRNMHIPTSPVYKYHVKTYGHPSEFGYHDFIPMFKGEHFNAEEWADLFYKAGAKFAGPVAEHHDGFSMWDSKITPWNSKNKGPKIDITGALEKTIKAKGLKFITTFHHSKQLQRYRGKEAAEFALDKRDTRKFSKSHYPLFEGMPPAENNPEFALLYGNVPEDEWNENIWFGKLKEVIDQYQPDIIWFDSWLDQIPETYRKKFCAYYLNEAKKLNKEVVIVRKQDDLPLSVSVDDLEKSRKNSIEPKSWMTDETVSTGSWCYTKDLKIKPSKDVLHVLIDIVSKNGVLLLNISPKADGTILEDQKNVLLDMGEWLGKYGESIYATRPWYTFGEGPTKEPDGHFKNAKKFLKIKYSNKDIRYTTKGKNIYAIVLGIPEAGKTIVLKSFNKKKFSKEIEKIEVLGSKKEIEWTLTDEGLQILTPNKVIDTMATVFKITTK
ncbi:MAG: alpha-L-fucosidase [Flavobacteriaceae bacterium]|nr:MAG: alpha-L-fucosidase [Flavobacteriaceae bacterium]